MKKLYVSFILALFSNMLFSQMMNLEWAQHIGSNYSDKYSKIALDLSGNIIATGNFFGTVDFDPSVDEFNLVSIGDYSNAFIQKLNTDGELIWAKYIGGSTTISIKEIVIDIDGNSYYTGTFRGTIDFDPGAGISELSAGSTDIFILKLDVDGEFIWVKHIGGVGNDSGIAMAQDADNNIYITGFFGETTDFDPSAAIYSVSPLGIIDLFILKLNADGEFIWVKTTGQSSELILGAGIVIDETNAILVTGRFSGTIDFDYGIDEYEITAIGEDDVFIQKLNADGEFIWTKRCGGINECVGRSITVDNSENVYIVGTFFETIDLDPGIGSIDKVSEGSADIFVVKLDQDGNSIWGKTLGSASYDLSTCLAVNDEQKVFITGSFRNSADFDPNEEIYDIPAVGEYDIFIQVLTAEGDLYFAAGYGSSAFDHGQAVALDDFGNLFALGDFQETVDFDLGTDEVLLTSNGDYDGYLQKINICIHSEGLDIVETCNSFEWINGITYTETTYDVTHTIEGGAESGCDSIVTLSLTILGTIDLSTTATSTSIISNQDDATYQWLDCKEGMVVIDGATEQEYFPDTDGTYAVIVSKHGCSDTSDCSVFLDVEDYYLENKIQIYPNPSKGYLNFDFGKNQTVSIQIFNINGAIVYQKEIVNEKTFSTPLILSSGSYIIAIKSENSIQYYKLVNIE